METNESILLRYPSTIQIRSGSAPNRHVRLSGARTRSNQERVEEKQVEDAFDTVTKIEKRGRNSILTWIPENTTDRR
jgi:hypothetical protein